MKTASFSSSRTRQRIIERTAHDRRTHLVRGATDEFHARRVRRQHEHRGEFLVLHRDQSVVSHERIVRQHRAGGDHLGARDDETGVGFLLDVAADVADLVRRPVAIDRRMDDRMIDERHALLAEFVPASGVVLVRIVEIRVGAEGSEKRRLVVRRAPHPAVGHARPFGDGVAAGDQVIHGLRRLEEGVRHSAIAGVGRQQQLFLSLVVMQRVEQARHHAGGVAEGRMGGDVLDAFAIDEDLAAVAQRLDIFRAGLRFGNLHLADIFRPPRESGAVAAAVGFRRLCRGCLAPGRPGRRRFCHCALPLEFDRFLGLRTAMFDIRTFVRKANRDDRIFDAP